MFSFLFYESDMWSKQDKETPRYYFEREALDALVRGIHDCVEFDVRDRQEVQDALTLLSNIVARDQGARLYKEGLDEPDPILRRNRLRHAYEKILMQTGLSP